MGPSPDVQPQTHKPEETLDNPGNGPQTVDNAQGPNPNLHIGFPSMGYPTLIAIETGSRDSGVQSQTNTKIEKPDSRQTSTGNEQQTPGSGLLLILAILCEICHNDLDDFNQNNAS
jgi:hypothetical protein